jgi:hypothetical protein
VDLRSWIKPSAAPPPEDAEMRMRQEEALDHLIGTLGVNYDADVMVDGHLVCLTDEGWIAALRVECPGDGRVQSEREH